MQQLFNVSEHFSTTLDNVRGPDRKNHYLKQAQAWVKPSGARRAAVRTFGYGGVGLIIGTLGFMLFRNRDKIKKVSSNLLRLVPTSSENQKFQDRGNEKLTG